MFKITDMNGEDFDYREGDQHSSDVKLFKILDDPITKGKTIHYEYDFGDGWEYVISCIGRTDATKHFICLEGEDHGCAEDSGGSTGWKELLEAYDAQNPTKAQKQLMSWFEEDASNKDPEGLRGELKWKWHKDKINQVLAELHVPPKTTVTSSPSVLLISLDKNSFFDQMYSRVLAKLRFKAKVMQVTHIASAMQHLSVAHRYVAAAVTDPEVMEKRFVAIHEKLVDYARTGGAVVVGFHCSNFVQFDDLTSFFKDTWSVNWTSGDYTRSEFLLNPRANPAFLSCRTPDLPQQYSMKTLHLGRTRVEERIYISSPSSTQSPAVFTKYSNGYLGWIGDVNTEDGTTEVLLTMCGV